MTLVQQLLSSLPTAPAEKKLEVVVELCEMLERCVDESVIERARKELGIALSH